jgi:hypothetical protein
LRIQRVVYPPESYGGGNQYKCRDSNDQLLHGSCFTARQYSKPVSGVYSGQVMLRVLLLSGEMALTKLEECLRMRRDCYW